MLLLQTERNGRFYIHMGKTLATDKNDIWSWSFWNKEAKFNPNPHGKPLSTT